MRLVATLCLGFIAGQAAADPAVIENVEAVQSGATWRFDVTLRHGDTGAHYVDAFRVLDTDGNVLGTRVLLHSHENEQPFTRSLMGVALPEGTDVVQVESRDTTTGWSGNLQDVQLTPDG
ncbi:hypothetical protein [Chachezhania antarctica]|uniref:hypothetical protein n=1 Tax=Chachezhania antarctica TaxID=2340860 RepID=UPI000EB39807|nr:hypothetical protein [Chachezhania antarctica]|tara:strand:+ start:1618 stop:1977 length:360 start_codon:yes stop_codon:yes gene_type:complete